MVVERTIRMRPGSVLDLVTRSSADERDRMGILYVGKVIEERMFPGRIRRDDYENFSKPAQQKFAPTLPIVERDLPRFFKDKFTGELIEINRK